MVRSYDIRGETSALFTFNLVHWLCIYRVIQTELERHITAVFELVDRCPSCKVCRVGSALSVRVPGRQKLQMNGLTRSETGWFIAVTVWQQWASKG